MIIENTDLCSMENFFALEGVSVDIVLFVKEWTAECRT